MTLEFNDILLYTDANGKVKIEVIYEEDTFQLRQKKMAELFDVESHTVTYHLKEIYQSGELIAEATTRKFRVVQREGNRDVNRVKSQTLGCMDRVSVRSLGQTIIGMCYGGRFRSQVGSSLRYVKSV